LTLPPDRWAELARHVYEALEDEAAQPLRDLAQEAPESFESFSELETSLSEWSFGYGVAWALARTREPFASSRRVSQLAGEATAAAWRSFGDPWRSLIAADRAARREAPPPAQPPQSAGERQTGGGAPPEGQRRPAEPQLDDFMSGLARARARRARAREEPPGAPPGAGPPPAGEGPAAVS
jgi:hypothetical protein